jgi:hypothetical protein
LKFWPSGIRAIELQRGVTLMSEVATDLPQIRGDWSFHMSYVQNAIEQTMKRQLKLWDELKAGANSDGQISVDNDELLDEFIEACRQTRALMDDLQLMREQKPTE